MKAAAADIAVMHEMTPGMAARMEHIRKICCEFYGVTSDEFISKSRRGRTCLARHAAMYLGSRSSRFSASHLSMYFDLDHSTIAYGISSFDKMLSLGEAISPIDIELLKTELIACDAERTEPEALTLQRVILGLIRILTERVAKNPLVGIRRLAQFLEEWDD